MRAIRPVVWPIGIDQWQPQVVHAEQAEPRHARSLNARHRVEALVEDAVALGPPRLLRRVVNAAERRLWRFVADVEHDDVRWREAWIDARQVHDRAQQQAGRADEQQRHRELRGHERPLQPAALTRSSCGRRTPTRP